MDAEDADAAPAAGSLRMAYLVSRYPAVTHTFIAEEVRALRAAGAEIHTFSVRRPAADQVLGQRDRAELAQTVSLVPADPARLIADHVLALAEAPGAYLSTLRHALRHRGPGARAALWQFFYFLEAIMLWRRLAAKRLRHVHVHFPNVAADVAALATRYGRARGGRWTWSLTLHGPTEFFDVAAHRLAAKVGEADAVVCISDFTRSQVMACTDPALWERMQVVRCGIDLQAFTPTASAARDAGGPIEVLNVAALSPRKGQSLLLEAIALMRGQGVAVSLAVVGDGPERARLQRVAERLGIAGDVRFLGALGHERVRERYAHSDLFCLPSLAEGVPIVLMEAMACGVPVVASAVNGIPELVRDGQDGLVVAPARPDLLAEAMLRVINDRALGERLSSAGRQRVAERHELHACARQLAGVLLAVTAPV